MNSVSLSRNAVERIILKWSLKKLDGMERTGFICFGIQTSDRLL
jgi:hypothetical protein